MMRSNSLTEIISAMVFIVLYTCEYYRQNNMRCDTVWVVCMVAGRRCEWQKVAEKEERMVDGTVISSSNRKRGWVYILGVYFVCRIFTKNE